jgi:chromatin remodeling complex protein RSC6
MEGKQVSKKVAKQQKKTEEVQSAPVVEQPVETVQASQAETTQDGGDVSLESFEQVQTRMSTKFTEASKLLKEALQDFKLLSRVHQREVKSARKNRRSHSASGESKKANPSGFNKPTPVPEVLVEFLGLPKGAQEPRTKLTSLLYDYIRTNGLQNHMVEGKLDKRTIVPDEKLRTLFGLKKGETIEFKTFQTYVSRLYKEGKSEEVKESAPVATSTPAKSSGTTSKKATKTA